jgi:hypothetical protein
MAKSKKRKMSAKDIAEPSPEDIKKFWMKLADEDDLEEPAA